MGIPGGQAARRPSAQGSVATPASSAPGQDGPESAGADRWGPAPGPQGPGCADASGQGPSLTGGRRHLPTLPGFTQDLKGPAQSHHISLLEGETHTFLPLPTASLPGAEPPAPPPLAGSPSTWQADELLGGHAVHVHLQRGGRPDLAQGLRGRQLSWGERGPSQAGRGAGTGQLALGLGFPGAAPRRPCCPFPRVQSPTAPWSQDTLPWAIGASPGAPRPGSLPPPVSCPHTARPLLTSSQAAPS